MRITLVALLVAITSSTCFSAGVLDFEDLPLTQMYDLDPLTIANPDSFTTNSTNVQLREFYWLPTGSTKDGFARVEDSGVAGGSGNELFVNNVNLDFDFGTSLSSLSLLFGEHGGNVNLSVNGVFQNVDDFQMLPPVVGGVNVIVSAASTPGTIELVGNIDSFMIGGQELWIDDVKYVPEPSSLAMLGTALILLLNRRRLHVT